MKKIFKLKSKFLDLSFLFLTIVSLSFTRMYVIALFIEKRPWKNATEL